LLLISENAWESYVYPWAKDFVFKWPEKLVNGNPMTKLESDGNVSLPDEMKFSSEVCPILGLSTGTLLYTPADCQIYKCPDFDIKQQWWKIFIAVSTFLLIFTILLTNKHKAKKLLESLEPYYVEMMNRKCSSKV
jgi:hypothetical protein